MTDDAAGLGAPRSAAHVSVGADPGGGGGWEHPRLQRELHVDLIFGELLQLMVLLKREIGNLAQQESGEEPARRLGRLLWKLEESDGGPGVGHSNEARPPDAVP